MERGNYKRLTKQKLLSLVFQLSLLKFLYTLMQDYEYAIYLIIFAIVSTIFDVVYDYLYDKKVRYGLLQNMRLLFNIVILSISVVLSYPYIELLSVLIVIALIPGIYFIYKLPEVPPFVVQGEVDQSLMQKYNLKFIRNTLLYLLCAGTGFVLMTIPYYYMLTRR